MATAHKLLHPGHDEERLFSHHNHIRLQSSLANHQAPSKLRSILPPGKKFQYSQFLLLIENSNHFLAGLRAVSYVIFNVTTRTGSTNIHD